MTKYSMGDFKIPALKTLASLAPVGVEVKYDDFVAALCATMGINMSEVTDPKVVLTPLNNAMFDLKSRGCIEQSRRGVWSLTQAGADYAAGRASLPAAASKPAKTASGVPTPEPAPVAAPAPVAPVAPTETVEEIAERLAAEEEPAPAPKAKRVKTAKLTVVPAADAPAWIADNYLRGLVAANTPCFGQFSPNAAACGGCALAPYCRNAQAATLCVFASKLVEEEVSAATAKLHAETGNALSPNAPRATVMVPPKALRVTYDGVCSRTGVPMNAGETGYYIPGEGICSLASLTPDERAAVVA